MSAGSDECFFNICFTHTQGRHPLEELLFLARAYGVMKRVHWIVRIKIISKVGKESASRCLVLAASGTKKELYTRLTQT